MTCVGGTMAPELLQQFKSDTILNQYVVGVDANEDALGRHFVDAFYQVPFGEAEGYIDVLTEIIRKESVELVIPGSDQEAFVISDHEDYLNKLGAKILTSPMNVLDLIRNKFLTYQTLEREGISVPKYYVIRSEEEFDKSLEKLGYPNKSIIIKPIAGRGGRGMRVLLSEADPLPAWIGGGLREQRLRNFPGRDEIQSWLQNEEILMMPALRAPAYDADVYAEKGQVKYAILRKRLNPAGIPFIGNVVIPESDILKYCKRVSQALKLDGLHDFDFMTDHDGGPALLEINPRMSGSCAASHVAGYPIVNASVASRLGIDYPISLPTATVIVKTHIQSFIVK
jgi:carbamoyl-phosphate synthase large subunit